MKETYLHPRWNGNWTGGYDVALAQLYEPVENARCPKLPAAGNKLVHNHVLHGLGWGMTGNVTQVSDALQMSTDLIVIKNAPCPGMANIYDPMLCLYSRHHHACEGGTLACSLVLHRCGELVLNSRDLWLICTCFYNMNNDISGPIFP